MATSYDEASIYLLGPSTASLSLEEEVFPSTSCDVTLPEPPRASKKRRWALSPRVTQDTEPPRTRVRTDTIESTKEAMAVLSTLSTEQKDTVLRAAELGLYRVTRPRAVNRRHAVSREYPVPQQVIVLNT